MGGGGGGGRVGVGSYLTWMSLCWCLGGCTNKSLTNQIPFPYNVMMSCRVGEKPFLRNMYRLNFVLIPCSMLVN